MVKYGKYSRADFASVVYIMLPRAGKPSRFKTKVAGFAHIWHKCMKIRIFSVFKNISLPVCAVLLLLECAF